MAPKKETIKSEKKNWYADRYQYVVVQRNILALITLVSLLSALVAAFSISQLAPLKSVEPFVIQVDQKSGITQVIDPITATEFSGNEAVNQYFIVQFIRSRESVGINDTENYRTVYLMANDDVFSAYAWDMNLNNKEGMRMELGGVGGYRAVRIGNLQLLDTRLDTDGTPIKRYQVRVIIDSRGVGGQQVKQTHKLITLEFKYAKLKLSLQDRYLNPLGFRVLDYRVDDDALNQ